MDEISGKIFVRQNLLARIVLSVICLVCYIWHIGFYEGCPWWNHLAYVFCHANIFHLAINLMVLWSIKNKINVIEAIVIAFAASFLPMYVSEPTMGLSGFLFAAFGCMWGKTGRWKDATKKVIPFILITMVMPNVNGLLHFYCFLLGYLFETLKAAAHHE